MRDLNRRKLRVAGLAAAAATLVAVPSAGADASAAAAAGWQAYPVPVGGQAVLDSVVAPTAGDAWAGGFTVGADGFSPLMLHWNGSGWATVSVPDTTRIDELSSTGAGDVWAMTDDQPLRWNGSKWVAVPLATVPDMNLGGALVADGPHDAWYVGGASDPSTGASSSLVEEWNGRAWTVLALPASLAADGLADIAAQGPDDVWVDGLDSAGAVVLAHWNGYAWTAVPAPATGFAYTNLSELMIAQPNDVWLAGWGETADEGGADRDSLMMHWNGSTWAISPTPAGDGELYDMTETAGGPWVVGDTYHESGVPYYAYALRWTGASWAEVSVPSTQDESFDAVAAIPGGGVWVVGATTNDAEVDPTVAPVLLRYPTD
jgi:hypothetical protein